MEPRIVSPSVFVETVRSVLDTQDPVGLHEPSIGGLEKQLVVECLDSTLVSSIGPFVQELEEQIKRVTGAGEAIAVTNGTIALQVALFAAGVRSGDEVIVPALSFVATANAVSHAGAVPYFVDVDSVSLGLDPEILRQVLATCVVEGDSLINPTTGRRVSAIVPMHTIGHPARISEICEIADEFGVPVVEDAAESLGSFSHGKHTGTFGLLGVISFNGNKIVTSGGGGVIITDDKVLAQKIRHLTTTAKVPHSWRFFHDEIAWNFRMPNLNAALGVAQLRKLPEFLNNKRLLADSYKAAFEQISGIDFISEPPGTESNYWLSSVILKPEFAAERDELLEAAIADGIQCRPLWEPLPTLPMYSGAPRTDIGNTLEIQSRVISLPSSAFLGRKG